MPPPLNRPPAASAPTGAGASPVPGGSARRGKGLTHAVVEALGARLTSRAIQPGDKLPTESVIMQTFGVSRGVVREALSRLQAAGLVQTHHGVGTFALEPAAAGRFAFQSLGRGAGTGVGAGMGTGTDAVGANDSDDISDMLHLLELRTSIESDAAGLAATRRSDAQLRDMHNALDDFAQHLQAVGETVAPDFRFHLAIAQATGNPCFSELMGHLGLAVIPRTRVSSSWLDVEQGAQHLHKVNQEHQDIYGAIARQDPEAARAAMRIHLVNSRERQRLAHARGSGSAGNTGGAANTGNAANTGLAR